MLQVSKTGDKTNLFTKQISPHPQILFLPDPGVRLYGHQLHLLLHLHEDEVAWLHAELVADYTRNKISRLVYKSEISTFPFL